MAATETFRTAHVARPGFVARLQDAIANWTEIRETRNQLNRLTDRELSDIGLCRGDIERVARGA